jgi:GNAT superfamily N-acetyltransferase
MAMLIPDGYHDLPPGALAVQVTYLEMRARAPLRAERPDAPWTLRRVERPANAWYRDLYRLVGSDWLWSSRLELTDEALAAVITHPDVEVFALEHDGRDEGILELDFRETGECEVGFFGLATRLVGTGAGRWLMNRAIARAWSRDITRFWLHTCSMDSPDALPFYLRSGFVPYQRRVEVFPDPRLTGVLPLDAAPQIPRIDP